MRYENIQTNISLMYEYELKSYDLIKVQNIKTRLVRLKYLDSTDEKMMHYIDCYYLYNTKTDEFEHIMIKTPINGRVYDRSIWNMALASMPPQITVIYNGTDEAE